MIITKLEQLRGGKVRVYLNDEPAFVLYQTELSELSLHEHEELLSTDEQRIMQEILAKRAKLRCMNILKEMDKSEWQLRQKLRQGEYPESVIDEAIDYVKGYHYLDDLRFAESYTRSRGTSKSRTQIKGELLAKGVKGETIEEAFAELGEEDSEALIRYWIDKKHFDPESADAKERQKFIQFLMRKGFSYGTIMHSL